MSDERLTDEELREIEARASAATPGPWLVTQDENDVGVVYRDLPGVAPEAAEVLVVADWAREADVEFIAHSRTDNPRLVRALREERSAARADQLVGGVLVGDVDRALSEARAALEAAGFMATATMLDAEPGDIANAMGALLQRAPSPQRDAALDALCRLRLAVRAEAGKGAP